MYHSSYTRDVYYRQHLNILLCKAAAAESYWQILPVLQGRHHKVYYLSACSL